jgi:hypothetical protein
MAPPAECTDLPDADELRVFCRLDLSLGTLALLLLERFPFPSGLSLPWTASARDFAGASLACCACCRRSSSRSVTPCASSVCLITVDTGGRIIVVERRHSPALVRSLGAPPLRESRAAAAAPNPRCAHVCPVSARGGLTGASLHPALRRVEPRRSDGGPR